MTFYIGSIFRRFRDIADFVCRQPVFPTPLLLDCSG